MTDKTTEGDRVIAAGVGVHPIEANRRLFTGRACAIIAAGGFADAAFHMAALNGLSRSGLIAAPRWVQATLAERAAQDGLKDLRAALGPAGKAFDGNSMRRLLALADEVAATAPRRPRDPAGPGRPLLLPANPADGAMEPPPGPHRGCAGAGLPAVPGLWPCHPWAARAARQAAGDPCRRAGPACAGVGGHRHRPHAGPGQRPDHGDRGAACRGCPRPRCPKTSPPAPWSIRAIWWCGVPLPIATFGAIVTGWFERRDRAAFTASDIVLSLCAVAVALYLIPIWGTAARNAVDRMQPAIGVSFAATR